MAMRLNVVQRPGNEAIVNAVYPGFVSRLKNGKGGRPWNEAKGLYLYHRCSCNMQLQECQLHKPIRNQLTLLTQKAFFLKSTS